jgi:hypothetical protein
MGFFSNLFGPSMPPLPSSGPILVISYGTTHSLGLAIAGTLHLDGDSAGALWSTMFGDNTKRVDHDITPEFFRVFWNAFDSLPEFRKGWIKTAPPNGVKGNHNLRALVVDRNNPPNVLFERIHVIPLEGASELLRDLIFQAGMGHLNKK